MKKAILTLTIILGMTLGAFAQWGGGLFQRGAVSDEYYYDAAYQDRTDPAGLLNLPSSHGNTDDVQAPLGSGALLLISLGAAYLVGKKRKEE